jgi:MFS family permease
MLLDYIFFGAAYSLVSPSSVVPDFVSRLTTSEAVIGLAGSVYQFAWLVPQLLFAQMINRSTRRRPYMTRTVVPFRLSMGVMSALIAFSSPDNHTGILITFLAGYAFFALGDGLVTIVWADMLGSSIPEHWRGALFGAGQIVIAITTLGTREIVRLLLGPTGPAFPQNYGLMFGIATIIFIFGGFALAMTREEEHGTPVEPGPPMRQYLGYLGRVLRQDREFRQLTIVRLLFDLTMMGLPFYVVFGATELKLHRDALVADSVLLATMGTTIASILMGWLSRKSGSRAVIRLSGLASALHPGMALLSLVLGQPALYLALALAGFVNAAIAPGYFDWIITHAPPDRRPIYVGLANTISAISHLAPFVGGFILKLTSYPALFGLATLIAALGLFSSLFLSEPRRRARIEAQAVAAVTSQSV